YALIRRLIPLSNHSPLWLLSVQPNSWLKKASVLPTEAASASNRPSEFRSGNGESALQVLNVRYQPLLPGMQWSTDAQDFGASMLTLSLFPGRERLPATRFGSEAIPQYRRGASRQTAPLIAWPKLLLSPAVTGLPGPQRNEWNSPAIGQMVCCGC